MAVCFDYEKVLLFLQKDKKKRREGEREKRMEGEKKKRREGEGESGG
jgi:hypothetical protein